MIHMQSQTLQMRPRRVHWPVSRVLPVPLQQALQPQAAAARRLLVCGAPRRHLTGSTAGRVPGQWRRAPISYSLQVIALHDPLPPSSRLAPTRCETAL